MEKFIFGSFVYEYRIIRQDRKTLSLTVTPDLGIILKCPVKTSNERIQQFLRKKWFWLNKQLSYFKKYQRKTYKREYISGENTLYLGRQYMLAVKKAKTDHVVITKNKIIINTTLNVSDSRYNKKLLDMWFAEKTYKVFNKRLEKNLENFRYKEPPEIHIREMQKRWGSFLDHKKIILNPKLIHTSRDCIDYVITHELCHFKHKKHDTKFFKLLKQKYPTWEKVKDKLEMYQL